MINSSIDKVRYRSVMRRVVDHNHHRRAYDDESRLRVIKIIAIIIDHN